MERTGLRDKALRLLLSAVLVIAFLPVTVFASAAMGVNSMFKAYADTTSWTAVNYGTITSITLENEACTAPKAQTAIQTHLKDHGLTGTFFVVYGKTTEGYAATEVIDGVIEGSASCTLDAINGYIADGNTVCVIGICETKASSGTLTTGSLFNGVISDMVGLAKVTAINFIKDGSECTHTTKSTTGTDVSKAGDKSVVAVVDSTVSTAVDVYYNTDALVFNEDCSYMFDSMSKLTSITGLTSSSTEVKLNMLGVTNAKRMFFGCDSLTGLDLTKYEFVSIVNANMMFQGCSKLVTLKLGTFDFAVSDSTSADKITNTDDMFYWCSALTSLDVSGFNTANVKRMANMFSLCSALASLDLSSFDTSSVGSMQGMFSSCTNLASLKITESKFTTANVEYMASMFSGCKSLDVVPVSKFDTSKVTDMSSMFNNCTGLTSLNLENFNTAKVTNMSSMFSHCSSLTSFDISSFDTSNVTTMKGMFDSLRNVTLLDLSSFNTAKVTDMSTMFDMTGTSTSETALATIVVDPAKFVVPDTTTNMFDGCTALVGEADTAFAKVKAAAASGDYAYRTSQYAHVDSANNPGYLTANTHTVTFTPAVGSAPETQTIAYGKKATEPDSATYATASGWYTDANYVEGSEFDFSTPIVKNTTLYASRTFHWTEMTAEGRFLTPDLGTANDEATIEIAKQVAASRVCTDERSQCYVVYAKNASDSRYFHCILFQEGKFEKVLDDRSIDELDKLVAEPGQWTHYVYVIGTVGNKIDINDCTFTSKDGASTIADVAYWGDTYTPVVNLAYNGTTLTKGENSDYTVVYKDVNDDGTYADLTANAGKKAVILTGVNDYKGEIVKTYNITKATPSSVYIKLKWGDLTPDSNNANHYTTLYNGEEFVATAEPKTDMAGNPFAGMGTLTVKYSSDGGITWSTTVPKNANRYIAAVTVEGGDNFNAGFVKLSTGDNWTLTVNKRTIKLSTDDVYKTYDGTALTPTLTVEGDGLAEADKASASWSVSGEQTKIGCSLSKITYSGIDAANYDVTVIDNMKIVVVPGVNDVTAHATSVTVKNLEPETEYSIDLRYGWSSRDPQTSSANGTLTFDLLSSNSDYVLKMAWFDSPVELYNPKDPYYIHTATLEVSKTEAPAALVTALRNAMDMPEGYEVPILQGTISSWCPVDGCSCDKTKPQKVSLKAEDALYDGKAHEATPVFENADGSIFDKNSSIEWVYYYKVGYDSTGAMTLTELAEDELPTEVGSYVACADVYGECFDTYGGDIPALYYGGAPILVAQFDIYTQHTVTFNVKGHGKAPASQTVRDGKTFKQPTKPTANGYTFAGWYTDKACTKAYDFTTEVSKDITLYAKWTRNHYVLNAVAKAGNGTAKVTWNKIKGASYYVVYATYCKTTYKTHVKTTSTSFNLKKLYGKKLKAGKNVKFYVVAYGKSDKKIITLAKSFSTHVVMKANSKTANATKVTVKKAAISLKAGARAKVGAKVTIAKGKRQLNHASAVRYHSSNKKIATVTSNGTIIAKKAGTCKIYAYALNGKYACMKVTVK